MDVQAWDNTLRQCLTSCMLGTKYALPPMLAAGSGSIVNIDSLAGIRVTRYASYAYHAAHASAVHLSDAAAVLSADRGLRVHGIALCLPVAPNLHRHTTAARGRSPEGPLQLTAHT